MHEGGYRPILDYSTIGDAGWLYFPSILLSPRPSLWLYVLTISVLVKEGKGFPELGGLLLSQLVSHPDPDA